MDTPPLPPGAVRIAAGETLSHEVRKEREDMQREIYGCTVAIQGDAQDESEIEMGTGVVVEIGPRTFVATVGHVISKRPRVLFGPEARIELGGKPTAVLKRDFRDPWPNAVTGDPHTLKMDVGFLEVAKDSQPKTCYFESLTDAVPPDNTWMMIIGHPVDAPGSLADSVRRNGSTYNLVRTAHSGAIKEVRHGKYVFGYPEELLNFDAKTGHMTDSKSFKTPRGFSGGGLWARRDKSVITGIHYPGSMYRLFGLQYAWSEDLREVYCVPIQYWLKLVYDAYPDLHDIIKSKFPEIESVTPCHPLARPAPEVEGVPPPGDDRR